MGATLRLRFIGIISALAVAAISSFSEAAASGVPAFGCTNSSGGSSTPGTVTSIRVAHHSGFDRLVIGFATSNAVPQYDLQRQTSSIFTRDASGQSVILQGAAGVKVVLRNADISSGVPADLKPGLPEIREVSNIGNFERVVSYGVGLQDEACLRVFTLSGPSRLVIDVQTAPDAAPASASNSAHLPDALATTGQPAAGQHPDWLAVAVITLGVLALTAGSAILSLTRFLRR